MWHGFAVAPDKDPTEPTAPVYCLQINPTGAGPAPRPPVAVVEGPTTILLNTLGYWLLPWLTKAKPEIAKEAIRVSAAAVWEGRVGNARYVYALGQRVLPQGARMRTCHDVIAAGSRSTATRAAEATRDALTFLVPEFARVHEVDMTGLPARALLASLLGQARALGATAWDDHQTLLDRVRTALNEYAPQEDEELKMRLALLVNGHGAARDATRELRHARSLLERCAGGRLRVQRGVLHEAGVIVGTITHLAVTGANDEVDRLYDSAISDADRGHAASEALRPLLERGADAEIDLSRVVAHTVREVDPRATRLTVPEVADALRTARGRGKAPVQRAIAEIAVRSGAIGGEGADPKSLARGWRDRGRG